MTSSSPENNCPIKMHIKLERRLADKENDYSPYIATSDTTKQQSSSSVSKPAESTDPDEKSLYIYDAIWKENYFSTSIDLHEPRGPKYLCIECNEYFVTRLSLSTHSQMHRKFFCIICAMYFENKQDMNKHLTSSHANLVKLIMPGTRTLLEAVKPSETICALDDARPIVQKSVSGRKLPIPKRSLSQRKKNKIEAIESAVEVPTRTLKSRFGRCITVKMPNY